LRIAACRPGIERSAHALAALLLACAAGTACAHKASDAYLQVDVQPHALQLRWDVALRDLDAALPLDADGDRQLTWGELRAALPAAQGYLLQHLQVPGCVLAPVGTALERRSDGTYLALMLHADCVPPPGLPMRYTLFAGVDATHRGIAQLRYADGRSELRLLDPDTPVSASGAAPTPGPESFLVAGVHHILTGYDHLLFLLCLLLPNVLGSGAVAWRRLAGIVTLFTLAHSTTLALAALGHVRAPSALVEPGIALTIALAALDNVVPLFGRWRAVVTFGFGLLHGLGFAGVLAELPLPTAQFGWALLRFNLGLELGQLAALALAAPLLAVMARTPTWRRALLRGGSAVAGTMALVWLTERSAAWWA
jgi:hypothetical protein